MTANELFYNIGAIFVWLKFVLNGSNYCMWDQSVLDQEQVHVHSDEEKWKGSIEVYNDYSVD